MIRIRCFGPRELFPKGFSGAQYSLSHHLCAQFNVCSQALDCASALDRVYRFQPLYLLMAARQTSIITTTAPPAPTLVMNVETEPAVFTTPAVVFPTRVEQHPSIITSLLALVTRVRAATIAPRKVLAGTSGKLSHTVRHRLSLQNPSCQDHSDSLSCHSEPR